MNNSTILNVLLTILLPPLITICVAALAAAWHIASQYVLARTPANLQSYLATLAQTVVQAIEQSMQGASGQAKKMTALQDIQNVLASMHLNIPDALVNAAIEAAVIEMKHYFPSISVGTAPVQATPIVATQAPVAIANQATASMPAVVAQVTQ